MDGGIIALHVIYQHIMKIKYVIHVFIILKKNVFIIIKMLSDNSIIIISVSCILLILLFSTDWFDSNSLCRTGDLYCKNIYGTKSYCAFHNPNPTCYDSNHNDTNDYCSCKDNNNSSNSYNIYIILSVILILFILCICFIPSKSKPIEHNLEFMFS